MINHSIVFLLLSLFIFSSCKETPNVPEIPKTPESPTIEFNYPELHVGQWIEIQSDIIEKETNYTLSLNDLDFTPFSTQDSTIKLIVPENVEHGMISLKYDNEIINLGEVQIFHIYAYDRINTKIVELREYDGKQVKILYDFSSSNEEVTHMVYSEKTNTLVGQLSFGLSGAKHFTFNVLTNEFNSYSSIKLSSIELDNEGNLYGLLKDKLVQLDLETGAILEEYSWTEGEELFYNPINNSLRLRTWSPIASRFNWQEFDLETKSIKDLVTPDELFKMVFLENGSIYSHIAFDSFQETDINGNEIENIYDLPSDAFYGFSKATQKIYIFYSDGGNFNLIKIDSNNEPTDFSQGGYHMEICIGTTD